MGEVKKACQKLAAGAVLALVLNFPLSGNAGNRPIWPTNNNSFFEGKPLSAYIQASEKEDPVSGTFGFVRDEGKLFHGGIDLLSVDKTKRGFAVDQVRAILPGRVAFINDHSLRGDFGRYVIIEHDDPGFNYYTFYGHLASVIKSLSVGDAIEQGTVLGVMGCKRCSGFSLAKSAPLLHFEIGLRLGSLEKFESWYVAQNFKTKNVYGLWNKLNRLSFDPLGYYNCNKDQVLGYVRALPIAFTLKIGSSETVDLLKRCPGLLVQPLQSDKTVKGWLIDFTWFGLPINWLPIYDEALDNGKIDLTYLNKEELTRNGTRDTIVFDKSGNPCMGKLLEDELKILFGFEKLEFNIKV